MKYPEHKRTTIALLVLISALCVLTLWLVWNHNHKKSTVEQVHFACDMASKERAQGIQELTYNEAVCSNLIQPNK